jgi:hypothetical protein
MSTAAKSATKSGTAASPETTKAALATQAPVPLNEVDRARAAQGLPPAGTPYRPAPKGETTRQLPAGRYSQSEYANRNHTVTIEQGTTIEEVANPAFFAHIAHKVSPYDVIRVLSDDGTIYAELLVRSVGRAWVATQPLHWVNLTTVDVELTQAQQNERSGYLVVHKGPHLKWCVVRRTDSAMIHEGDASEEACNSWLGDYLKATSPRRMG